jgi:hypothetical protein
MMSRWMIERSGTGIGKSGTGIEKSGTGIEKSGTGIEKDGTGIEKSGTGIRRFFVTCTLAGLLCTGSVNAGSVDPAGTLQVVVQDNTVAVSWIIGESVFSGVSRLSGTYASLMLTEVALAAPVFDYEGTVNGTGSNTKVTGNGTGSSTKVTGNGTGNSTEVTGNGTGSSTDVTGNGTGSSTDVTGNGTGSSTDVTGNGTGSSTDVTGNGTGSSTDVTGNGTGSSIQVTGNGTGGEAITITFPQGTGMIMEVSVGCGSALVTVLDQSFVPIVEFTDVAVYGDARFCDADVDEPGRGENKSEF